MANRRLYSAIRLEHGNNNGKPNYPVNLGSGKKVSIKQIIKILQKIKPDLKVKWDVSKPSGDKIRLMIFLGIKVRF